MLPVYKIPTNYAENSTENWLKYQFWGIHTFQYVILILGVLFNIYFRHQWAMDERWKLQGQFSTTANFVRSDIVDVSHNHSYTLFPGNAELRLPHECHVGCEFRTHLSVRTIIYISTPLTSQSRKMITGKILLKFTFLENRHCTFTSVTLTLMNLKSIITNLYSECWSKKNVQPGR